LEETDVPVRISDALLVHASKLDLTSNEPAPRKRYWVGILSTKIADLRMLGYSIPGMQYIAVSKSQPRQAHRQQWWREVSEVEMSVSGSATGMEELRRSGWEFLFGPTA